MVNMAVIRTQYLLPVLGVIGAIIAVSWVAAQNYGDTEDLESAELFLRPVVIKYGHDANKYTWQGGNQMQQSGWGWAPPQKGWGWPKEKKGKKKKGKKKKKKKKKAKKPKKKKQKKKKKKKEKKKGGWGWSGGGGDEDGGGDDEYSARRVRIAEPWDWNSGETWRGDSAGLGLGEDDWRGDLVPWTDDGYGQYTGYEEEE